MIPVIYIYLSNLLITLARKSLIFIIAISATLICKLIF